ELVEHDDVVVVLEQPDVGGPDEPRAPGDEQLHVRTPMKASRPSCQAGSRGAPRSLARTELAGRAAGRGNSSVVHGRTSTSMPARSKIARANSNQEQEPEPATCRNPCPCPSASATSASARWPVNVGQPTWSSTTLTWPRSSPARSIVVTKF